MGPIKLLGRERFLLAFGKSHNLPYFIRIFSCFCVDSKCCLENKKAMYRSLCISPAINIYVVLMQINFTVLSISHLNAEALL